MSFWIITWIEKALVMKLKEFSLMDVEIYFRYLYLLCLLAMLHILHVKSFQVMQYIRF